MVCRTWCQRLLHAQFHSIKGSCYDLASLQKYSGQSNIKQLLDEVKHDTMNYQKRGMCYLLKPKAKADNTDTFCFIVHFSHNSSSETEGKRSAILFLRRTLQGSNQADVELDMINVISAADITFIM